MKKIRPGWLLWGGMGLLSLAVQASPPAGQAHLELHADAACLLKVNGQPMGVLNPGARRTLALPPGEPEVVCAGQDGTDNVARERPSLRAGETVSVRLRLRWTPSADGVRDRAQRLLWTRQDNGADIDWPGARTWCESLGQGWRLPGRAELESLTTGAAGETTPCRGAQCKAPALFTLTSYWMWSGDRNQAGLPVYHYLHTGHTQASQPDYRLHARALCVRPD